MSERSNPATDSPHPGTEVVALSQEALGDTLLTRGGALLLAGANLHPGIVPNLDAVHFDESAAEGEKFFVSTTPYDEAQEAEAEMLPGGLYNRRLGLSVIDGGVIRTIGADLAEDRPLIAKSSEELEAKIAAQKALQARQAELVDSSELGEGTIVLTNEFGGIDASEEDLGITAQDLVLRAMLARAISAQDVGNLVEAGLIDDRVAQRFYAKIANLFKSMNQNLDVLDQLPEATLKAAGPPILEHLVNGAREFVIENRFGLQALALAIHDKEDIEGLYEFTRNYRPPVFRDDYTFDGHKPGYRAQELK